MNALLRFLYDTAGRVQDVVEFNIEGLNFKKNIDMSIKLKPKKSHKWRKVVLSASTVNAILIHLCGRDIGFLFT